MMTANDSEGKRRLNRGLISSIGLLVVLVIVVSLARPSIPGEASPIPTLVPPPQPSVYEGRLPTGAQAVLGLGKIVAVDLSPDGKSLAVLTGIGLGVYQIEDLSLVWFNTVNAESLGNGKIRWSPDGSKIAIVAYRDAIIWDAQNARELFRLNRLEMYGHPYGNWDEIAWSPDSSMLAVGGSDREVLVWDAITGKVRQRLLIPDETVFGLQWSPDGQWLAAKLREGTTVWNAITGEAPKATDELPEFDWPATEEKKAISPDGSMIVSVSSNRVVIQNAETKSEIETTHQIVGTAIESLAWSADGATLASYSRCFEGMCFPHITTIWDMNTATPLDTQFGDTVPGFEVLNTFSDKSPDGSRYLTIDLSYGTMTLWDASTNQAIRDLDLETTCEGFCLQLAWSPDSRRLAAMIAPNLFIWDAHTGILIKKISPFPFGYGIAFSPDGKLLATTVGGAVIVWQVP